MLEGNEDGVPVYSMGVMDKVITLARDNLQKYCFIRTCRARVCLARPLSSLTEEGYSNFIMR